MKIDSPDITHKTDVGGVALSLMDAAGVRSAYGQMLARVRETAPKARVTGVTVEAMLVRPHARELLVGVLRDPVFGPAITFGAGGVTVEVLADRAVALPPLNTALAREMIAATRVSRLLAAFRGMPPADLTALENVLLRVSAMVCELPQIREMDINPVLVDERGAIALDARVVVQAASGMSRTYGHMAIHPYPAHLAGLWRAPDGREVAVRPIRPEDADIEREFVRGLSPSTKYLRFMNALNELTPAMLARFTQIDYDREMAFIATVTENGKELQIGVCRYVTDPDGQSCEFAVVVAEAWQGLGLGRHLLRRLIDAAKDRGLERMHGEILGANRGMLDLVTNMGFGVSDVPDTPSVKEAVLRIE
jgi:acetyltransferase